jgi:hypothetical protein
MKRAVLILLAAAALACSATADEKGMGTLAGTVLSQSGKPVAEAHVTSQGADGSHPQVTTTNAQGRFFFPDLVHGYYNVRAYHAGAWTEWKRNVEVNTGKQTEVKLHLAGPQKKTN